MEHFEIVHRDGGGRIGKLKTAHGTIATPCFLPVVNPVRADVPVEKMKEMGVEALMTNAYLFCKRVSGVRDVHQHLGFEGPIMTDSGGFQILKYGEIEAGPEEMVEIQEEIRSDIAVILDVPTSAHDTRAVAEEKVRVTLERAEKSLLIRRGDTTLWCAPVQGGKYLDLVEKCATRLRELDYHVYGIGGPVEYFEEYHFWRIVDLVMTAKKVLPLSRPVHLFGAGHPMVFSLAVLMGCDTFDSAAYSLFAKDDRYMTPTGTIRVDELRELPCECPVCAKRSCREVKEMPEEERKTFLLLHNLFVSIAEVRRIRQAIWEGRLWEYTQKRCYSHPALLEAFRRLAKYSHWLERFDPVTKPSGFLYVGPESAYRPEVLRHRQRMSRYTPPPADILVIVPHGRKVKPIKENFHLVKVVPPFGVVPEELSEFYPLGQHEVPMEMSEEERELALRSLSEYLRAHGSRYKKVILLRDEKWGESLLSACEPVKERLEIIDLGGELRE